MKRFRLVRLEDPSGVSGTGEVAEGVMLTDHTCVMQWLVGPCSIAIYDSPNDIEAIHSHGGSTTIEWID